MTTFTVITRGSQTADDMMDEKDMAKLDQLWAMRSKDFLLYGLLKKNPECDMEKYELGRYGLRFPSSVVLADEGFTKVSFTLRRNKHTGDVCFKNVWVSEVIPDENEDVVLE